MRCQSAVADVEGKADEECGGGANGKLRVL